MQYKLAELINGLDVTIQGDPNCLISGVCPIQHSKPGHITFLTNALYRKHLPTTQAAAVILSKRDAKECPVTAIVSANPYLTYAKVAAFFEKNNAVAAGIHPAAHIGEGTQIHPSASIAPYAVIGKGVRIGANAVIGPHCYIGDDVEIGESARLDASVTIYERVKIGKRTRIASGVVIGADGFGFANEQGAWQKVPQLGSVQIGDDVDIGANTTIDRGALEDTVIEDGVKMDNLIQIGHNVRIGANTIMAGCTGVAGSTTIGKNCMIGGASCINGHLVITDNVVLTGTTGVEKSILEPGIYSSGIVGALPTLEFKRNNARFYRLENLMQRVKALEGTIQDLLERNKS